MGSNHRPLSYQDSVLPLNYTLERLENITELSKKRKKHRLVLFVLEYKFFEISILGVHLQSLREIRHRIRHCHLRIRRIHQFVVVELP